MLFNALIHRDYFKQSMQTQVKIFDDYLWSHNAGTLPQGVTLDQLKTAHRSVSRNPLIMDIFYRAGFVEEVGSGTRRIIKAFKEAGLPEPEFKEEFAGFSVYFRKDVYTLEKLKELGLNDRQLKALTYLREKQTLTNMDYRQINETSPETAKRDLAELCKKRLIIRRGAGPGTYYELIGSIGS